jgi:hypothetical protein
MPVSGRAVILGFAAAIASGAIVAGLIIVGSPSEARMRRLDERRVRDLVSITRAVNAYWTRNARLPASLGQLVQTPATDVESQDPLTSQPYAYGVVGGTTYELCADFQANSQEESHPYFGRFWSHPAGRHCFRLDAENTNR